ncbi:MAG: alpha-2-macroglobulin family protein [Anaerolineae bacterium]
MIAIDAGLAPLGEQEEVTAQRWELEVTVTDETNFPITQRGEVTVHPARFCLGLRPQSWVAQAREPAAVEILALDWDALPVADQQVEIKLAQRTWTYVPSTQPFQPGTWTYEDTVVQTLATETDENGEATFSVTPPRSGPYVVLAESVDTEGNAVRSETHLWVSGTGAAAWRMAENKVEPIADAQSYRPGDVARVLLPTPFEPPYEVLMTIEREGILYVERFTAREASPLIEIPIEEQHVPNIVVSFVVVKGVDGSQATPDIRVGMVQMEVEPVEQTLTVSVTPECADAERSTEGICTYEPGDTVTLAVRASGAGGEPADAEVALAVVDKAVLALADDNAPSLLDAFYAPRELSVMTGDGLLALNNRLHADMEALRRRAQQIAREYTMGGIGGGGGGMPAYTPDVRQEFPDTVFWEARLRTGPGGEVEVNFRAPDSLTTWVADARAVTEQTEVGQTTQEFRVTRPLLVRPVTPRFFVAGDRAEVAAVVHNNTANDLEVDVGLETNMEMAGPAQQRVSLPAEGQTRVSWTILVPESGFDAADLTFSADGGGYRDAARPSVGRETDNALPIYRYETPEVVSASGALTEAGSRIEVLILPPEAGPDSTLTLTLEPSLAAGMLSGLDYLKHYPHECIEQLVSRFLPNLASYQALSELGLDSAELERDLEEQVDTAVKRLLQRQSVSGGWGRWWSDTSDLQVSAYATWGLVQAKAAGFDVDDRKINNALNFLERRLASPLEEEGSVLPQTLARYVLAEAGREAPESLDTALYESRETLGVTERAYLALAWGVSDPQDPRVVSLLKSLRADVAMSAGGAQWEETEREHWVTATRATAVALDTFARLAPDDPLVPQAVRWLMAGRTRDHWSTTQETAWAVMALTDVMVATGELDADYDWGIALNAEAVDEGTIAAADVQTAMEYVMEADDLRRASPNALEISRGEGDGTLYYTADLAIYQPVGDLTAESRGVTIDRQYCKAENGAEPEERDRELTPCTPVTTAHPGDLIEVRLTLTLPRTRHYLVVEDFYPAGMEPVDPTLRTEQTGTAPSLLGRRTGWWWPRLSHEELRDERAVFYADRLSAGTYQLRYYLRAAVPGEYGALPATASEMYFPEVWGRSAGALFVVEGDE